LFGPWISASSCLEPGERVSREARPGDAPPKVRKPTKALPTAMSDENRSKPAPGPEAMAAIGRELRRMYADIIAEGVPERFAEILRKLDEPSNEGETR
jgi:hypothetical protein